MRDTATEFLDPPADVVAGGTVVANGTMVQDEVMPAQVIAADLLVEEISIDGMCGVY